MNRFSALDGLRGLACIIVVIYHYILSFFPSIIFNSNSQRHYNIESYLSDFPFIAFYNGHLSVIVFFVLSSFILSVYCIRNSYLLVPIFFKRYLRLMIPVLISCVIAYIVVHSNLMFNTYISDTTSAGFWLKKFYTNDFPGGFDSSILSLLQSSIFSIWNINSSTAWNPVLWTMSYEFIGSIFIFIFFKINSLFIRMSLYFILIVFFINSYFFPFILGAILAEIYINRSDIFLIVYKKFGIFIFISIIILSNIPPKMTNIFYGMEINFQIMFHSICSLLIIVVILNNNVIYNGLSNKFFLKMGSLSFSIYLLHFIILCSYSSWLFNLLFLITESYMLSFFISFITSWILIYYMSLLFYKFIDNKAIILSQLSYIKLSKWSKLS